MALKALRSALALLSALGITAANAAASGPELTAEQIVERNVAARGGLEAWRKVDTMTWIGHLEGEHAPMAAAPFLMHQARPNKTHFEVKAIGRPTLRVFDGVHGWKARPGKGEAPDVRPYTPQENTYAARSPGLVGPLIDYRSKGNAVDLEGLDEIDGHRAYRLRVGLASGEVDHVWIDASSFLEIRNDRPSYGPKEANQVVSVFYRDYKDFEGLKLPSIIETAALAGQSPDRMTIERVMVNPRLDKRAFAEPGLHAGRGEFARRPESNPARRLPAPPATAQAASALGTALAPSMQGAAAAPNPPLSGSP